MIVEQWREGDLMVYGAVVGGRNGNITEYNMMISKKNMNASKPSEHPSCLSRGKIVNTRVDDEC